MDTKTIEKVIPLIRKEAGKWELPGVSRIINEPGDLPFKVLVSTLLSLRTKDETMIPATRRLLRVASTPEGILELKPEAIEKLIYPVGFYKTKTRNLLKICSLLVEQYAGEVPRSLEQLLELPGVGRKTANLVLILGFHEDGMCVDTHVHRISNLLGYIQTKNPDESEQALREKLPRKYWKTYNDLLVAFGQNLCVPVSPWCSRCPVEGYCGKVGLRRNR